MVNADISTSPGSNSVAICTERSRCANNGPEFAAKAVRHRLGKVGVKTLFIEPGSPWENGYIESFNARLRKRLLDGQIFYPLEEVRVISGQSPTSPFGAG